MRYAESPSSCYTYDQCPKKYYFRYIEKLPDITGPAAQLGKDFEEAVYPSFNSKEMPEHKDSKIDSMLKALFSSQEMKGMPKVVGFQEKIDVVCGSRRLLGYMDMRHEDNSITDLKTSKSLWDEEKLSGTEQHIAYPYGAVKSGLLLPSFPILFRFLIVTTSTMPKVQLIEKWISEEDFLEYEKKFQERILRIKLQQFPTKKSYKCNWCPYKKSVCPAWSFPSLTPQLDSSSGSTPT